jgi:Raf kinase inhibitor-like YbhB/YbcL family protein
MQQWMPSRHAIAFACLAGLAAFALAACGGSSGSKYGSSSTATPGAAATATAPPTGNVTNAAATAPAASSELTLTSPGFKNGGDIPLKYSCSGEGKSPALDWRGVFTGVKSFVLIAHDPDAPLPGGFTHWIVVDIPSKIVSFPAAVPPAESIAGGGTQLSPYSPMCPPVGASAHHYHFRLYALDATLGAVAGKTKDSVEAAMKGHILRETDLVGLFARPGGP